MEQDLKITKDLVSIIMAFLVLHVLRVITALGELVVLLNPNKDYHVLQRGYGVPAWLKITADLSDFL